MKITVIDDVISKGYQNLIEENFSSADIGWFYTETSTNDTKHDTYSGFSQLIFKDDNPVGPVGNLLCNLIFPVLLESLEKYKKGTNLKQLFRIRAGMFLQNQTDELYHAPHIDGEFKHYTLLYYIMDSDGPTRLFSDGEVIKEIEPKKGRAVFFSGDTYHASCSPREHSRRMTLNYNFMI